MAVIIKCKISIQDWIDQVAEIMEKENPSVSASEWKKSGDADEIRQAWKSMDGLKYSLKLPKYEELKKYRLKLSTLRSQVEILTEVKHEVRRKMVNMTEGFDGLSKRLEEITDRLAHVNEEHFDLQCCFIQSHLLKVKRKEMERFNGRYTSLSIRNLPQLVFSQIHDVLRNGGVAVKN